MVFTLDFPDLLTRYPNAFVRIDEMKCDGNAIQFNANNFFYGDIEGKGNYRVELFNIYGVGAGWQSVEQCFQQFPECGFRIGIPLQQ